MALPHTPCTTPRRPVSARSPPVIRPKYPLAVGSSMLGSDDSHRGCGEVVRIEEELKWNA